MNNTPPLTINIFVPHGFLGSAAVVVAHVAARVKDGRVRIHRTEERNLANSVMAEITQIDAERIKEDVPHPDREIWICGYRDTNMSPAYKSYVVGHLGTPVFEERTLRRLVKSVSILHGLPSCIRAFAADVENETDVGMRFRQMYEDITEDKNFEILTAILLEECTEPRFDPTDNVVVCMFMKDAEDERRLRRELLEE